jgi:hypothetical protein
MWLAPAIRSVGTHEVSTGVQISPPARPGGSGWCASVRCVPSLFVGVAPNVAPRPPRGLKAGLSHRRGRPSPSGPSA